MQWLPVQLVAQEVTVVLEPPAELAVKVVVLVLWVQMVMAATAEAGGQPVWEVMAAMEQMETQTPQAVVMAEMVEIQVLLVLRVLEVLRGLAEMQDLQEPQVRFLTRVVLVVLVATGFLWGLCSPTAPRPTVWATAL